jgi:hypothetical protein
MQLQTQQCSFKQVHKTRRTGCSEKEVKLEVLEKLKEKQEKDLKI